ncbi:hypothetical protein BVRB_033590 [Beta vulgaris subsp. vulgaris]|uniref:Uncharacterized protein n=1 Tax=Beta vulgaris subsp. vulgaris TaxID=3555 RepID=A0A0J8AIX1_BETVV|nr:hypothetical protein BVRB_033590 [Beta vulgaris subsp. vulgaris]
MQKSYSIERFHDDIIDALTHEETRSDNANLVPIPTQTRASGDSEKIEMLPLSDLFNVPTQPKSTEIEAPAADFQSQALGHEIREESQPIVGDGISQTLNYLLDNVASQLAA